MSLPGRGGFAEAAAIAGIEQPWRPITIAPELTINSLWSLVVPAAALCGIAALSRPRLQALLPFLIALAFLSALLGVAQMAQGDGSPLRFYRITNQDMGVGFFANRNHQAALLVLCFPMLAVWAAHANVPHAARKFVRLLAVALGLFLIPMILVTGSRAGLVLGILAACWACFQYAMEVRREQAMDWRKIGAGLTIVAVTVGLVASFAFTRAQSLQRLVNSELRGEGRLGTFPTLVDMVRDTFPVGTGFGSFDPFYRIYEPYSALTPSYLNHAHNDLLELLIVGGAPALLLLGFGLFWLVRQSLRAFQNWRSHDADGAYARLGAVMIWLLLGWSLLDYPLRTPILAVTFALACGWLASRDSQKSGLR
jgi:O-antigen ligase